MATINVKDAAGATVALEKPLVPGRAAAAASRPVALSTEDAAFLDGIETNQATQITAEQAIQATAGATTGAAVVTDANGTIQQYLRGLVKRWVDALGAGTAAAALRTTLASDDPAVSSLSSILTALASVAHDGVDSGNPLKIGGKALAALSAITLVASGDRVNAALDLDGALIVRNGGAIGDRISAVATNTDGTSTSCIAAQASGIKTNLTDVTICNSSASFVTVDIRDGAAGTVKWTFPVPPSGGVTHRFETPISGTAATAWCFDPSAAATTITCSMAGRLSKV